MSTSAEHRVAQLAWNQVAARIEGGAAAVLPVGAGAKEHGLHLPMNTDQIQAEWLAGVIAQEIDALIWPTLTYGFYPAFVNYAGSASLSAETFRAVLGEIIAGLAGFGVRAILVVDTGISTIGPVAAAIEASPHEAITHHLRVQEGPRYRKAVEELGEQSAGSHADELETSRMLALAPDVVVMERAQASPPGKGGSSEPLSPDDSASPNYSPGGSWGDPTLASRQKGEALLTAMAEDVAEMARNALAP